MKNWNKTALACLLAMQVGAAFAAPADKEEKDDAGGDDVNVSTPMDAAEVASLGSFCFIAGRPVADQKFTVVRKLKLGKQTYGSVRDILPAFASRAKALGANAMINYTGSQRFGFLPWRMVRPVVRGTAVKMPGLPGADCAAVGGMTLDTLMSQVPKEADGAAAPAAPAASQP